MKSNTPGTLLIAIARENPKFAGLNRKELADALGVTYETLRRWVEGLSAPSRHRAQQLADVLGCHPSAFMKALYDGAKAVNKVDSTAGAATAAHVVSFESVMIPPRSDLPIVQWRNSSMLSGLERFCVVAPDDSMEPVVLEGMKVEFDSTLSPLNKDVVLVEDSSGDWYIRTYLRAPNDRWKAKAEHGDYVLMDKDEVGLSVLGVMVGTHGRRG